MSDNPYVNFYTSDFLAGTSGMTAATKGVYITLLCLMYEAEAPLPQRHETLARRCGCTLPAFERALQVLEEEGKITAYADGLWSEKCEKHIALRCERRKSATAAAKTRWEKIKQNQGGADATASVPQCQPEPEPEYTPIVPTGDDLFGEQNQPKDRGPSFTEFWDKWPLAKVSKQRAASAFKRLSADDRRSAIAECEMWCRRWRVLNPTATDIHPATYLNSKRWTDETPSTRKPQHGAGGSSSLYTRLAGE